MVVEIEVEVVAGPVPSLLFPLSVSRAVDPMVGPERLADTLSS